MLRAPCIILASTCALCGQSATPQFEVASIQSSTEESGHSGAHSHHGRVAAENISLKECIMRAYSVGPLQVAGGPSWLNVDRFNIEAKAEQPTEDDDLMNAMLGTLLAEAPVEVLVIDDAEKPGEN